MKIDHISWSKEERFQRCGHQFYLIYAEKLKRPPGVAQIRGIAPHRSVEADLKAKLEGGALLKREEVGQIATDYVDKAFKGEVSIDGEYLGLPVTTAREMAKGDAREMAWRHHDRIAPAIRPTALEVRVEANFPDLPIPYEGVIDIVDAERIVRDMKTKRKSPEASLADTSEQLTVYHGLFHAYFKRPPERLVLDVVWRTEKGKTNEKTLPTQRTDDDLRVKFRRTQRFLEALEKEIFLPAGVDDWICSERYCGFTDICPYFRGRPRPVT